MNKVQFHRLHNPRNISMFMYCFLIFIMFSSHALEQDKNADDKNSKPNILVFMIDDLRPDLGSYGHAHALPFFGQWRGGFVSAQSGSFARRAVRRVI